MTCRQVNKEWNTESSKILRNHRKVVIDFSCEDPGLMMIKFNQYLEEVNGVVPFNGLKIKVTKDHTLCAFNSETQPSVVLENIFSEKFLLRFLTIEALDGPKGCCVERFCSAVLQGKASRSSRLEELELLAIPDEMKLSMESPNVPELLFPQLKLLHLNTEKKEMVLAFLLSEIELNLEVIYGLNNNDLILLPPSKYPLVKDLRIYNVVNEEIGLGSAQALAQECAMKLLALEKITMEWAVVVDIPFSDRLLGALMTNSSMTLTTWEVPACVLIMMNTFGLTRVLEKVHTLILGFNSISDQEDAIVETQISVLWKLINFVDLFPSLKRVELVEIQYFHDFVPCECIDDGEDVPVPLNQSSLSLVEELVDEHGILSATSAEIITKMFPNVKSFKSLRSLDDATVFSQLWNGDWKNLDSMGLTIKAGSRAKNWDSIFCGIHEEEAELLRTSSSEFLRAVNIVPIRPPIAFCHDLRELRIYSDASPETKRTNSSLAFTPVVSKVTSVLAFKKLPKLAVWFH